MNTKAVYKLFREINGELGTAFMIVTHDRSVAQQTDRILEIRTARCCRTCATSTSPGLIATPAWRASRPRVTATRAAWYPSASTVSSAPDPPGVHAAR